ncbi:carboxylating nicotinate-nucleotide diphosphorylase [Alteribacillus iranensis]|uniref:Probable nicotinate-nucleotide pyrophosphorylase [carboxylating] n=1 Tax=Alteribacillus iranensis TaxID=930128 RepID=A0A1I2BMM7_9BACI|nr:carboxylating nicotinate-nucleotide diphosphorylase [Alteribacillus iranensis]SFE57464.1 nicotinate-nucleotide pyrophosphorylase [carboxylating] [Alteribacillus iranensis]
MNRMLVRKKINEFLEEDVYTGDITTDSIFSEEEETKGTLLAKGEGVFCGKIVLEEGLRLLDSEAVITWYVEEGDTLERGEKIADIHGKTRALLTSERVLLNMIQRMSGIATATKTAVMRLHDLSIQVCDTRKTAPGLRMFDKYAVRIGGGTNHRFGLYDAVMIKDNHIAAAGGIKKAVEKVREKAGHMVKVEVETTKEQEVREAVAAGADVIMLDNQGPEAVQSLTALIPSVIQTEISGNVTLDNIADYQGCGVDFISLGALTHSVTACDISFLLETKTTAVPHFS